MGPAFSGVSCEKNLYFSTRVRRPCGSSVSLVARTKSPIAAALSFFFGQQSMFVHAQYAANTRAWETKFGLNAFYLRLRINKK